MNNNDIFYNYNHDKNNNKNNNNKHTDEDQNQNQNQVSFNTWSPLNSFYNQSIISPFGQHIETVSYDKDLFYQNTRPKNTKDTFLVVLDSKVISGATANNFEYNQVKFNLINPIVIDSPMEVYLEYLHFQHLDLNPGGGETHLEASSQFYIEIKEFSIKNKTNNSLLENKIFIPNEIYGKSDTNANDNDEDVQTYFVRLKTNYLCLLEPQKINHLTISIYGEDNAVANAGNLYYLANRGYGGGAGQGKPSFRTCGCVKIALYFKKK
jgi:hypothetical protein